MTLGPYYSLADVKNLYNLGCNSQEKIKYIIAINKYLNTFDMHT